MGVGHALSGALAGAALVNLGGGTPAQALMAATVTAGYALLPDLDCDGSTAYRAGGPVSAAVGESLQALSVVTYKATATDVDRGHDRDGGHRHLLHTPAFALTLGAILAVVCLAGPWPVLAVYLVGVLLAHHAVDRRRFRFRVGRARRRASWEERAVRTSLRVGLWMLRTAGNNPAVALFAAPLAVIAYTQGWRGLYSELAAVAPLAGPSVTFGCLVHIWGDWLTYSGVPLLWPLVWKGERWHRFRSPAPFLAGGRFERAVMWPLLALGFVAVLPGAMTLLADLSSPVLAAIVSWLADLTGK